MKGRGVPFSCPRRGVSYDTGILYGGREGFLVPRKTLTSPSSPLTSPHVPSRPPHVPLTGGGVPRRRDTGSGHAPGHVPWARPMDTSHGHVPWTRPMDTSHGHVPGPFPSEHVPLVGCPVVSMRGMCAAVAEKAVQPDPQYHCQCHCYCYNSHFRP